MYPHALYPVSVFPDPLFPGVTAPPPGAGIAYRLYASDGLGGPVDESAPVADISGLTWDTPTLAAGSDTTFTVHPYDLATGHEDRTSDARVRVILDASGEDTAGLPVAPVMLSARPASGGTAKVLWYYPVGLPVAGFHVYAWDASGAPDWVSPVGSVGGVMLVGDGTSHARPFSFLLTGLADGVVYSVGVRGYNSTGEGQNVGTVPVTGTSTGPAPVVALTASISP